MFSSPFKLAVMLVAAFLVTGGLLSYFASADSPATPASTVHTKVAVIPSPVQPVPDRKCCPNGDCTVRKVEVQKHVENRKGEVDFKKTIEVRQPCPNGVCPSTVHGGEAAADAQQPSNACPSGDCYRAPVRRILFGRRR
jgi:hypothetical protein